MLVFRLAPIKNLLRRTQSDGFVKDPSSTSRKEKLYSHACLRHVNTAPVTRQLELQLDTSIFTNDLTIATVLAEVKKNDISCFRCSSP